jgi:two-component system heavy metal sensor histidine kinase CusS
MKRRMSLTLRLTLLFSLTSAVVLLGLGVLIWLSMDRHFADEDFVVLGDNVRLIQKVAHEEHRARLPSRLAEMVEHHPGFVAHVSTAKGEAVYRTKGFDFGAVLDRIDRLPPDETTLVWQQDDKEYRGMRAHATVPGEPSPLTVVVGMDTEIHAHFMHAFRRSLAFYTTLAVLASGLFGWWAARRGLAPLRTMASRAKGVTSNHLDARMPVETVPVGRSGGDAECHARALAGRFSTLVRVLFRSGPRTTHADYQSNDSDACRVVTTA